MTVTEPLQTANDVYTFQHDNVGRFSSLTDPVGEKVTFAYDAADRVTEVTHGDGTFEQLVYGNLDVVATRDRLGRWTSNTFNADRQLVQVQDPLGRVTQFQWCHCGALTGIIDAMGNSTTWDFDLQSRPIAKHYADGSTVTYVYENLPPAALPRDGMKKVRRRLFDIIPMAA